MRKLLIRLDAQIKLNHFNIHLDFEILSVEACKDKIYSHSDSVSNRKSRWNYGNAQSFVDLA